MIVRSDETRRANLRAELWRRMARPQRHRLLHGYPMAPLLLPVEDGWPPHARLDLDASRPLIVGVLPHTFCNPAIRGCGFCTFPHERHDNNAVREVVASVMAEVRTVSTRIVGVAERRVDALYFGGGTANLMPPDAFRDLAVVLCEAFDLAHAEVTLEGVPLYFLTRNEAMLDVLAAMPVRHRRISAGIQSFDADWLSLMGRRAFGTVTDFRRLVETAHARGMTTSCDLLFNLPGQTLEGCLHDVRTAIELGFDQVCVYNLVLAEDIESEWSRDRSLLRRVPDPDVACAHWLAIRRTLLDMGYVQTTLTNFERREIHATDRRFVYESCSFAPRTYDAIGFGPGAISTFTRRDGQAAVKWMNTSTSAAFTLALASAGHAVAGAFSYTRRDMQLLVSTRQIAGLGIDRNAYVALFRSDILRDFPGCFELFEDARLVRIQKEWIRLTPEGMFFADSIAGLLAAPRAAELRNRNDSAEFAMG